MLSKVYTAQNRLYDALKASPALSGVRVSLGYPVKMGKEEVWIGGEVEGWQFEYRTSGLTSRDEEFTLRVNCYVSKTATTFKTARDRVQAISDAVEQVIQGDPTLGGEVLLMTVQNATLDEGVSSDGRTRMVLETLAVRINAHVDAG